MPYFKELYNYIQTVQEKVLQIRGIDASSAKNNLIFVLCLRTGKLKLLIVLYSNTLLLLLQWSFNNYCICLGYSRTLACGSVATNQTYKNPQTL